MIVSSHEGAREISSTFHSPAMEIGTAPAFRAATALLPSQLRRGRERGTEGGRGRGSGRWAVAWQRCCSGGEKQSRRALDSVSVGRLLQFRVTVGEKLKM